MKETLVINDEEEENPKGSEEYFIAKRIVTVELSQVPLPISAYNEETKCPYKQATFLVCLHTFPLGLVELPFEGKDLTPHHYLPGIWKQLSQQINEHLRQDGLVPLSQLSESGLIFEEQHHCLQERQRFLEQAPFTSVIIATRDRPQLLEVCLQRLLLQNYPHYEIIVVDNAPSTGETFDLIQPIALSDPRVRYMREDCPGLSWAHNCGVMAARGDIMAFVDDDVVVDANWLVELVRAFFVTDRVGCVTGLVLPLELETAAQAWFEAYGGFSKGFTQQIFDMAEHRPKEPLYPFTAGRFGTGASMAFTAEFLRSTGGFDPAMSGNGPVRCGEDIALFFQVVVRGYRLVYTPLSLSYHRHRRDYAGLKKQIYNYGVGLTAYLMKSLLENPRMLLAFLMNIPYGLYFSFHARSPKNRKRQGYYPGDLTRLERKGMLYGPLAYILSRRAMHRLGKK